MTVTSATAQIYDVMTAMTSISSTRAVPDAPPREIRSHLLTASSETRLRGVTRRSSSQPTATHQRMLPAVRPVPATALDHQVRFAMFIVALLAALIKSLGLIS